jgi:hypothetical protein
MVACSITLRMPLSGKRCLRSCGRLHCLLPSILLAVASVGCGPARQGEPGGNASPEAAAAVSSVQSEKPVSGGADPAVEKTSRMRDLSFDDVKFEMEKGDPFSQNLLPEAVSLLDGTRIRIRGYILPSFQQEGITQFVLVRDNMECCFGPGAALYDCIVVRMLPGRSTNFSVRPVAVSGTFRIEELIGPDGRHLAIYSLDGEAVE